MNTNLFVKIREIRGPCFLLIRGLRNLLPCLLLTIWSGMYSCTWRMSREAGDLLEEAGQLVETHPDSALRLLRTMTPVLLTEELYHEYTLLRTQAGVSAGEDISGDTAVFTARDYFVKWDDEPKAALAHYYSGRVYLARKSYNHAITSFQEALSLAEKNKDRYLSGKARHNIGHIFYEQGHYREAIPHFMEASRLCRLAADHPHEILALISTGNCFQMTGQSERAFHYYIQALDAAHWSGDTEAASEILHNMGVASAKNGSFPQAKDYFYQSLRLTEDETERCITYGSLLELYMKTGPKDSAAWYAGKVKALTGRLAHAAERVSMHDLLSGYEADAGNYRKAWEYAMEETKDYESLLKENTEQSVFDVKNRYDFEVIRNKANEEVIKRQKDRNIWLGLALALVFIIAALTYVWIREKRKKEEAWEKVQTLKSIARETKRETPDGKDKKQMIRHLLTQDFEVFKKVDKLNEKAARNNENKLLLKEINEIIYGRNNHYKIDLGVMKEKVPGVVQGIQSRFPTLTDHQLCLCCFYYLEYEIGQILLYLNYSKDSLYKANYRIRLALGMPKGKDITEYLEEELDVTGDKGTSGRVDRKAGERVTSDLSDND